MPPVEGDARCDNNPGARDPSLNALTEFAVCGFVFYLF